MEVVVVVALLLAMILALLIGTLGRKGVHKKAPATKSEGWREPCPICGSPLKKGERLHSVVFRDGGSGGQHGSGREEMVHLFGCPHCYPPSEAIRRQCPVCRQTMPEDGHMIGRMWDKSHRKHLHLLGCTICRTKDSSG